MVDWEILELLQRNGRVSIAQLARTLRMSAPSVAERIKRLENAGIIIGYRAEIDPQAVGLAITAFVRVNIRPPSYEEFLGLLAEANEVRECSQVAEPNSFQVKVTVRNIEHLRQFTLKLNGFGDTLTSIVLSNPMRPKIIDRSLRKASK
jgi:Lrp/AsnC family leucine-responsive transcriptional regulator